MIKWENNSIYCQSMSGAAENGRGQYCYISYYCQCKHSAALSAPRLDNVLQEVMEETITKLKDFCGGSGRD